MHKSYLIPIITICLLLPNQSKPIFNDSAAVNRFLGTLIMASGLYLFVTEPAEGQAKRERDSIFVSIPMTVAGYIIATEQTRQALLFTQKNILVPFLNYIEATKQHAEKKLERWFNKADATSTNN
ncbi:MAG TPA: hypothetical protein VFF04_00575 [Candidatus Babeliales bacterium]|nr:hypothetical protein [Candidatus Babeliales bacterium]